MTKAFAPPPGSVLAGKYRVERQIGSGGMGVVVEATHLGLGQRVAIKILDPELATAEENVARFFREARVAATLPSEHIARVSDVGQTEDGAPYLVMELLVGWDLAAEIARLGQLPVAAAVDWALEACEGLADAHAAGLVHRDIKPQNLFLAQRAGRPPILKVLDFGLTKDQGRVDGLSLTQPGSVFGTPQYMSPEQVLDAKNVDARCDQHALGMILFEMLTGRPPYEGTAASALFVVIATANPPSARAMRPDVPGALNQAILRALAKQPDKRFASLAGFAQAIAPFGGPGAAAVAENVRRVLGGAATTATVGADPGAGFGPGQAGPLPPRLDDEKTTTPNVRAPAASGADLTSSSDLGRRRVQRAAITGGITIAVALAVGATVLFSGSPPDPSASHASTSAPSASEASPQPTVTPAETASAEAPPSAAAPSTSASAPLAPQAAPGHAKAPASVRSPSKGAPNRAGVRKAIGVFGGGRR
jgi:eukaryotic-like serine/threonine-protein kinase